MEPVSLLSGSDNLFKYLFTVGAVMIILSIVYPLQKSQEIQLQQANLLKEAELLNNDIQNLKDEYQTKVDDYQKIISVLDSLTNALGDKVGANEKFILLRKEGNKLVESISSKERELAVKNIIIKNDKSKTELLRKHSESFKSYYILIKSIGILFLLIGFIGWSFSTFMREKMSWINLQSKSKSKEENKDFNKNKTTEPSEKIEGADNDEGKPHL